MPSTPPPSNAVLDDHVLQSDLREIHPEFGDFCTRVAGEAWGLPHVDQATKALIAIAIDVSIQNMQAEASPFNAHVMMARKQGVGWEQIEEVLLFCCAYCGFNKAAGAFARLKVLQSKES
ncbi:carboxymuconolactone decarboxylase family protein [Cyanobium sp. HWJ4-Hawea]|uniref:carboxymuconolactone decarboxylase family protein n=1 Tax=Cyanobium sp. HWJ4-Hawea TaxID=2823713 RepID=UPI0020CB9205|nr:carboxymuconolactone decarboxylase family protein [Cyanobium sp. HWJ4-Hawea]MCP9810129.1 carboxymuconolactone decarboxylase family protein [Cyanobium sp. HWJ4-Hawea]